MKSIDIYTDGACSGNPGPGGWGAVLLYGAHKREISGGDRHTTNNRMELLGVIEALRALTEPCRVTLYTDSKYVADAINKRWLDSWVKKDFKRPAAQGGDVKNPELWRSLLPLLDTHSVSFVWVKGHADNEYNNRCDELARGAIDAMRGK
ncbi:MAG: ribonuclease HI [Oscillospiraceae bacterium]|nr:ribonuclease HI [Oscillospiraceae bacterium]